MTIVRPKIFDGSVLAAVSTRVGGVSPGPLGLNLSYSVGDDPANVTENRHRFFSALAVTIDELAVTRQVHSAVVRRVFSPGVYESCDALFTVRPRVFLCVTIADCVPILLHAPEIPAVGAVHAGWRGTLSRVTASAVAAMVRDLSCDPAMLRVFVGPAASACCYIVGEEVASLFDVSFVRRSVSGTYLDLKGANVGQLHEMGVLPGNIEVSPSCTISDSAFFHSFRRDGKGSGRMLGVIGIPSPLH